MGTNNRFSPYPEDFLQFPDSFDTSKEPSISPDTGQSRSANNNLPSVSSKAITDTGAFELTNINGNPMSLFLPNQYIDIGNIDSLEDHFQSETSKGFAGNSGTIVSIRGRNTERISNVAQIIGRKKVTSQVVTNLDASKVSRATQKIINF